MNRRIWVAGILTVLAVACSDSSDDPVPSETSAADTVAAEPTEPTAPVVTEAVTTTTAAPASFVVLPGSEQLAVIGAEPGELSLVDAATGAEVASGTVDAQGALLWRDLPPGSYQVVRRSPSQASAVVEVAALDDPAPAGRYEDQPLLAAGGFGYITVRDGTTLSANVMLPGPADEGPYPTVVEYSGYSPSNPDEQGLGLAFTAMGYAYVGVNMRGTGCSGGSYQFFEPVQSLDGYDVIEAVAAQPWVAHGEVGMVGVSYPGISQLFVAATQPPHLAAITPFSVLDDSYRSTLYPGGILNTGFALEWTQQRVDESRPFGQDWTKTRSDDGDDVCAANQQLRLQNPDLVQMVEDHPIYDPAIGDEINPSLLVGRIDVPVMMAGAFQDEQTGGRFPALIERFTSSPRVDVTLTNGLHTESIASAPIFARLVEFLDLYVARRTPDLAAARAVYPILVAGLTGATPPDLGPDRFAGMSHGDALAAFEAEPPIRVLFEEGAADPAAPGAPAPRFEARFDSWPPPAAESVDWYLAADGALADEPGSDGGGASYTADPDAVRPTFYEGDGNGIWAADVVYDWPVNPAGTAAVFTTGPFAVDTVIVGPGSVDLWVAVDDVDTDLEVTVSELRPDGTELYVQSGWLRASHRALDDSASTELRPVHTHLEPTELVPGQAEAVRVELFPLAHAFRAGSRLRLTVDAPGGNRGVWEFRTIADGETVEVLFGPDHPSRIVLPVVAGIQVPAGVPACGSLRGQPCRGVAA